MHQPTKYIPAIDGLRAVAVIAILIYHAKLDIFTGGYVGVDIFFVISGFLISSIILTKLATNTFSFKDFWLKRARRILPALMVLILFCLVAFAFIYPPSYYRELGQSAVAQTLFLSNVFFWVKSGYFDTISELKPLLHTWSLSAEEQFYFIFPILLWLHYTFFRKYLALFLVVICVVSFGFSVWASEHYPSASFYLLPTRAWELGLGGIIAVLKPDIERIKLNKNQLFREAIALLGIVLIGFAIINFDSTISFPSYNAALPVIGSALVITSILLGQTFTSSILSSKYMVFIGLISYSLYLWHWPILTINNWINISSPSLFSTLSAVLLSIIFAYLSYKFVEQPFRNNRKLLPDRKIVIFSTTVGATIIIAGLTLHFSDLRKLNFYTGKNTEYMEAIVEMPQTATCHTVFSSIDENFICKSANFDENTMSAFLIWGDSHANAFIPGFELAAQETDTQFYFTTYGSCPPAIDVRQPTAGSNHLCKEFNDAVIAFIKESNIKNVFLAARFNHYVEDFDEYGDYRKSALITDYDNTYQPTKNISVRVFQTQFSRTIDHLKSTGVEVHIIRQVPNFNINPSDYLIKLATTKGELIYNRPRQEIEYRSRNIWPFMQSLNVNLLDFTDKFCDAQFCTPYHDGVSLYRDNSHLSLFGSQSLSPILAQYLRVNNISMP